MNDFLIPLISGGIGGGITYYIKSLLDRKNDKIQKLNDKKRKVYLDFVELMFGIIQDKDGDPIEHLENLKKVTPLLTIFASDTIIKRFGDLMQYLYKGIDPKDISQSTNLFKKISKIVGEMRQELGLDNSKLGEDCLNIFRPLITDFEKLENK